MSIKELKISDFDKGLPYVPKNAGACAVLFKLNGCHWCEDQKAVFDNLNKYVGFMSFYTFTINQTAENSAHWEKIKKTIKNSNDLEGFPITMLYSTSGRVVVLPGFEEEKDLFKRMKEVLMLEPNN